MDSKYSNILKILTKSIDEQVGGDVIRNIPKIAKECQIIGLHLEKYLKLIKDPSLSRNDVINIISKVGCNKVSFSHNEATQIYRALTLEPLKNLAKQTGGAAAHSGLTARSPIDLIRHTFREDGEEITGRRSRDETGSTPIDMTRIKIVSPLDSGSGDTGNSTDPSGDIGTGDRGEGGASKGDTGNSTDPSGDIGTGDRGAGGASKGDTGNSTDPSGDIGGIFMRPENESDSDSGESGVDESDDDDDGESVSVVVVESRGGGEEGDSSLGPPPAATPPGVPALGVPAPGANVKESFFKNKDASGNWLEESGLEGELCLDNIPSIVLSYITDKIGLSGVSTFKILDFLKCQFKNTNRKSFDFPVNMKCDWAYFILFSMSIIPLGSLVANPLILLRAILNQHYFLAIITIMTGLMNIFTLNLVDIGWIFKTFYFLDSISQGNHYEKGENSWKALGINHTINTPDRQNCFNIWEGGISAARKELGDSLVYGATKDISGERVTITKSLNTSLGKIPENWWFFQDNKGCVDGSGGTTAPVAGVPPAPLAGNGGGVGNNINADTQGATPPGGGTNTRRPAAPVAGGTPTGRRPNDPVAPDVTGASTLVSGLSVSSDIGAGPSGAPPTDTTGLHIGVDDVTTLSSTLGVTDATTLVSGLSVSSDIDIDPSGLPPRDTTTLDIDGGTTLSSTPGVTDSVSKLPIDIMRKYLMKHIGTSLEERIDAGGVLKEHNPPAEYHEDGTHGGASGDNPDDGPSGNLTLGNITGDDSDLVTGLLNCNGHTISINEINDLRKTRVEAQYKTAKL